MKDEIKPFLISTGGCLAAVALAFALFLFGPRASEVFAAAEAPEPSIYWKDGLTSQSRVVITATNLTTTNYVLFISTNGAWLSIETNNFGFIARSKREPFLVTTNGDWPWLIRFYDPKLEFQRIQFTNSAITNSWIVTDTELTNYVNKLVSSGEFCRVRGHTWTPHLHVTLEYSPNRISCRQCALCGAHQSQYATEWK